MTRKFQKTAANYFFIGWNLWKEKEGNYGQWARERVVQFWLLAIGE
jgi:hypothetical protein